LDNEKEKELLKLKYYPAKTDSSMKSYNGEISVKLIKSQINKVFVDDVTQKVIDETYIRKLNKLQKSSDIATFLHS